MRKNVLEISEVSVSYEKSGEKVLEGISLTLCSGEKAALFGLNGSGKTTLLMTIAGLFPYEGSIKIDGIELSAKTVSQIREKIGFLLDVPDDQLLFPIVMEDVAFALLRKGFHLNEVKKEVMDVLKALEIDKFADYPVHHLSYGQKQRVALAGTTISKPPLLLLDEPSSGLDPIGKKKLISLLDKIDSAMLIATCDLDFVRRFCTRFIFLNNGKIIEESNDADKIIKLMEDIGG